MSFAIAAIATGVLGAGAAIYGANKAADAQKEGIAASTAAQQRMFDKQVELQAPFREAGITAQNRMMTLLGLKSNGGEGLTVDPNNPDFGKYGRDFGMADYQADPGYAFRISEGMKALERSAAARGGLLSGAALKGATRFGQDLASQEYGNAYTRYQTNRNNQLAPLTGLIESGRGASTNLSGAAGQLGQGLGQAAAATGSANAGAYINTGNAINNALSSGMNSYMGYNMMNNMRASQYGGGGVPTPSYNNLLSNVSNSFANTPNYTFG